jgi:hypothetical protein
MGIQPDSFQFIFPQHTLLYRHAQQIDARPDRVPSTPSNGPRTKPRYTFRGDEISGCAHYRLQQRACSIMQPKTLSLEGEQRHRIPLRLRPMEVRPSRPVAEVEYLRLTPDGRAYAYNYNVRLSDLYVASGLK